MKYAYFIFLTTIATNGYAQTGNDFSKKNRSLFYPVPKDQMRSFETDRPDATESAYTVDAGHFQVETDLFKSEKTNVDGIKSINNSFNAANLKLGITNSLDIQFVVNMLDLSKIKYSDSTIEEFGFGGLSFRIKQNIWGNDEGKTAFAVLPYLNFSTNSSRGISGGIVFPFAISLSHGWDFGAQFETEFEHNQTGDNYHFNYLMTFTTSHSIINDLDFFIEAAALRNNNIQAYEYFANGGFVFAVAKNINIDCGIYYGIKKVSSKTYFIGLSFRI